MRYALLINKSSLTYPTVHNYTVRVHILQTLHYISPYEHFAGMKIKFCSIFLQFLLLLYQPV